MKTRYLVGGWTRYSKVVCLNPEEEEKLGVVRVLPPSGPSNALFRNLVDAIVLFFFPVKLYIFITKNC